MIAADEEPEELAEEDEVEGGERAVEVEVLRTCLGILVVWLGLVMEFGGWLVGSI